MMAAALLDYPLSTIEATYPFETEGFYECWWQYLSQKWEVSHRQQDLLIYPKKAFKGLLSFKEARIAGWRHSWFQDLTETRVKGLLDLQQQHGWDCFRLTWDETRRSQQRFDLLQNAGYRLIQLEYAPQYLIDLRGGFETYLKSLSHNGRKALKKKVRLGQALEPHLVSITQESDIEAFYEEVCAHHIPYWTQKSGYSYFSDPAELKFHIEWAKALHRSGQLRLERLVMGGETVNLSMGVLCGQTFYWVLTINTGLHLDYSPGMVGLALRLEDLAQQGVEKCNMAGGDFFYKVQSSNCQNPRKEMVILNPRSLKSRLYQEWLLRKHPTAVVL